MNSRFEKIWTPIEILIIYMFSGLSMGISNIIATEYPIVITGLVGFGSLTTITMLQRYCNKNNLKIFGNIKLNLLGFIIWVISLLYIIYLKS